MYDDVIAALPTDRELRFRPWRASDAPAVLSACSEPSTQRWIAPLHGYDAAKAHDFVEGARAKWDARQHLRLCLTDATDAVLGSGDLDDLTFRHGRSELGWWIAPGHRGRGLGVRQARLLVRAGFEVLGLQRLTADIVSPNAASRWAAAGAGFHFESTAQSAWVGTDGARHDMETWRLLASEDPLEAQPELTAGSLHLRPWRPSDAEAVFVACQDPDIQRFLTMPIPYPLPLAEEFVGRAALTAWAGGRGVDFAVLDSVTEELLGSVGAYGSGGTREIGYWAVPSARGRGVITAAAGAVIRWLVATQGVEVVTWRAAPGNDASWRVAEKLGFQREGRTRSSFLRRGTTGPREDDEIASLLAAEVR